MKKTLILSAVAVVTLALAFWLVVRPRLFGVTVRTKRTLPDGTRTATVEVGRHSAEVGFFAPGQRLPAGPFTVEATPEGADSLKVTARWKDFVLKRTTVAF